MRRSRGHPTFPGPVHRRRKVPIRAIAWRASGKTGAKPCQTCGMRGQISSGHPHRIVAQDLVAADLQEGRRQAARIAVKRRGVGVPGIGVGEILRRQRHQIIGVLHRVGGGVQPAGGAGDREVGPWRQRDERGGKRLSPVAQAERQREGEPAAR